MTTTPIPQRFGSGQAVRRMEDDALLRGEGRFTDDTAPAGAGRVVFVRSPYAHARITGVDLAAARAMPGVRLVASGAELLAAGIGPMPVGVPFPRGDGKPAQTPPRPLLAHDRVRHVGEAVAVVVADTLQQARDAAEAVLVDTEDLPAVADVEAALRPDAPRVVDGGPDNLCAEARHGDAAATDAAFAQAAHVVALDLLNPRVVALTLEPRTVSAWPDAGRLTLRLSTQMPTGVRDGVAGLLKLEPQDLRVVVDDVGGGFGMKTGMYAEDAVVAWCAHTLQQPVHWVADRSEEFLTSYHGRDVRTHAELALAADGRILGLRVRSRASVGAYATGTGVAIQLLIGPWVQTSVYDVPTIDFHYQAVLTHTASTGAYRGAGRPEAIFIIERLMDEAARQTGIDRVALRRRNFIRPDQMPYRNLMGQTYDTGRFEHVMNQGLAHADWDGFAARAEQSRARGRWRGLGLATFLEWTGGNALEEKVSVAIRGDGVVEVFSAVNAMGQGIATTLAQLVGDVFGLPPERIRIVLGDTDRGTGFGSAGSRSIFTGGSAVRGGSEQAMERARALAAGELEVAPADLAYAAGKFTVRGTDLKVDLFDLAGRQPQGEIALDHTQRVSGPTWPNGCHVCEVEVDPDTGAVAVVAYASVNDIGRVINPLIVRGQLDGGAVQGLGQALCEAVAHDAESGQLLTGSLMDYAAPRADIVACTFRTETDESTPCQNNPLGVKGVGELGTIGATPCVVNAVADALARAGRPELAPRIQMPLTPGRLWEALHG